MVSEYMDPQVLGRHSLVSEPRFVITLGLLGIALISNKA